MVQNGAASVLRTHAALFFLGAGRLLGPRRSRAEHRGRPHFFWLGQRPLSATNTTE
jgi:hypothetical protein